MEKRRVQTQYLNIKFPSSFSSIRRFYNSYKEKYPESLLSYKDVEEFIHDLPLYQQHVTRKQRIKRRKIETPAGSQGETISFNIGN